MIVKICGIRNEKEAKDVVRHKPEMIGLIFVQNSIRAIDNTMAQKIAQIAHRENIQVVGVFQNQPLNTVIDLIASVPLDFVQLHGEEDPSYCQQMTIPVIKRIPLRKTLEETKTLMDTYSNFVTLFLIDRVEQGKGPLVNMHIVHELAKEYPIMIAGGLDKDTIENTIQKIGKNLQAVDTSSGVECRTGEKDEQLIYTFIHLARNAYETL